jgi:GNAT superfamily N-acetyltransferase
MVPSGVADDYDRVVAFYERLGRRPIAAVLPDSAEDALFRQRGWVLESHDADTVFQLAGVAAVRRRLPPSLAAVELREEGALATALVDDVASGVAAVDGDWAGFRSIEVSPDRRREGLGLAVMAALIGWAAERGATTAYLQVLGDNAPALALYERLRFVEHHRYRYLAAPPGS